MLTEPEGVPDYPFAANTDDATDTTARRSRSGLTVSGTVRFSPPPASSPTYNGSPRFIRGIIEVEGYVQGDGTLTLDGAVFQVRHG